MPTLVAFFSIDELRVSTLSAFGWHINAFASLFDEESL